MEGTVGTLSGQARWIAVPSADRKTAGFTSSWSMVYHTEGAASDWTCPAASVLFPWPACAWMITSFLSSHARSLLVSRSRSRTWAGLGGRNLVRFMRVHPRQGHCEQRHGRKNSKSIEAFPRKINKFFWSGGSALSGSEDVQRLHVGRVVLAREQRHGPCRVPRQGGRAMSLRDR